MKRSRFRLETVLRVRTVQENLALGALGAARAEASAARQTEAVRLGRYRLTLTGAAGPATSDEFLAGRTSSERLGSAVLVARDHVGQADLQVQERIHDWSVAARRVSGLERLSERHHALHEADLLHEDVLIADERTSQSHHLRITAARSRIATHSPSFPSSEQQA